jgi:spore coat polysaccharide biosynthesis predicted glycosyltransferase SpsG
MSGKAHIAIRADGGQAMGLGHIKRCETLARELLSRGRHVTFLTVDDTFVRELLTSDGFEVRTVAPWTDRAGMFANTVNAVAGLMPGVVFLDILNTEVEFVRALQDTGARAVSIDDLGPGGAAVDALVGEDVGVLEECLPPGVKQAAAGRIFGGLDYVILSERFTPLRGAKSPDHWRRRNLYVGFGGGDRRATTEAVVAALLDWPEVFTANVILGPCMARPERVEQIAARDTRRFTVHRDPPNLPQLMAQATLALCNVGQSLFELTYLGTPSLLITSSPLQASFADNYERNGCSVHLGLHDDFSKDEMIYWCGSILDDEMRWTAMHEIALRAIDGRGARRIADVIEKLL